MEEGRTLRAGQLQVEKFIEDSGLKQTQSFLGRNFVPKSIKTHWIVSISTGAALRSTFFSVPEQVGNWLSPRYSNSTRPVLHNSSRLRSIICTGKNSSISNYMLSEHV